MPSDDLRRWLRFDSSLCHCGRKFLFSKSPDENVEFTVDFQVELPYQVYVQSATVEIIDTRTGLDVTGTLFSGPATLDQDLDGNNVAVQVRVTGGTKGHKYKAKILATLDDTFSVWERNVEFNVK